MGGIPPLFFREKTNQAAKNIFVIHPPFRHLKHKILFMDFGTSLSVPVLTLNSGKDPEAGY